MRWRLPAKVNWTLRVLGRRPDGFHELRSWFVAVELCDLLEVRPAERAELVVEGEFAAGAPARDDNLVLRAEKAWREAGGVAPTLAWRLEKHIPVGAGLGGGSSDAAGALAALEQLATTPLGETRCRGVAAALGSDVTFFLEGEDAELRGGRGEVLLERARIPSAAVVLAWPGFGCPTPKVYAAHGADRWHGSQHEEHDSFPPAPGRNDLEESALGLHPELAAFRQRIRAHAPFVMSGSGSAFFASWPDANDADAVAARLREEGVWARAARLRSGPVLARGEPCR